MLTRATALSLDEISKGSQAGDFPFNLAAINAVQNRKSEAWQWLQQTIDYRWIDYALLEHSPYLENIQQKPEFTQIVDSLRQKIEKMQTETSNQSMQLPPAL